MVGVDETGVRDERENKHSPSNERNTRPAQASFSLELPVVQANILFSILEGSKNHK